MLLQPLRFTLFPYTTLFRSYSSDLFVMVQAARSWLEGKGVLQDNCLGNLLAIHTYFLLLPLGLLAKPFGAPGLLLVLDRKSTRLNSSHTVISYAVFCLKKKN